MPGEDGLAGLVVQGHLERRVLLRQLLDRRGELLLVAFVRGSTATWMTGSGNVIDSRTTGDCGSLRVSPVVVSLRPITA